MAGEHKAAPCDIISTTNAGTFVFRVRYSATKDLPAGGHQKTNTVIGGWVCDAFFQHYDDGWIRLLLMARAGPNRPPGRAKVTFGLLLLDKIGSPASTAVVKDVLPYKEWTGGGRSLFAKKDDVEANCVVDGYFAALCSVAVVGDWPPPASSLKELPDLGEALAEMLGKGDLTDVCFAVDGETFCAHRLVLAARSPVLRAELYGPMAESKMASIAVKDMKASTFRYMLDYMYRGILASFHHDDDDADQPPPL